MLIELYGLPGSGKTTLAKKLIKDSDWQIVKIKNRLELLFLNWLFLIKHPIKFFVTLFYVITNSHSWSMFYYKFMNCFLHHNAKYQKAKRYKKAILDQGYFQNILSVFEKPLSADFLKKYIRFLLLPDRLIILDVPFLEILKKKKEKPELSFRQKLGLEYYKNWLQVSVQNHTLFLRIIEQLPVKYSVINVSRNLNKEKDF